MFDSVLDHNNLGGAGPDGGILEMRYQEIGLFQGQPYDMVVTATSPYTASNNGENGFECGNVADGCINGRYAQINVAKGTSVDLTVSFQDSVTLSPVTLGSFLFSIHDIDQFSSAVQEKVYITGFSGEPIADNATEVAITTEDDGRTLLTSTMDGTAADNAPNPMELSTAPHLKKRAVAFVFQNTDTISMTLEVTDTGSSAEAVTGRSFHFTGDTDLVTCANIDQK